MRRDESIARHASSVTQELAPGVLARGLVSHLCNARGVGTGTVTLTASACLPYHTHPFSEAITVLEGELAFEVEGRRYLLGKFDCIHVPRNVAHSAVNPSEQKNCIAHYAFASERPTRELFDKKFDVTPCESVPAGAPEHIARATSTASYSLAPNTDYRDLFAKRLGSSGICGGYGEFLPGASLPCHVHKYDESITIVRGRAVCEVAGNRYVLENCDTAHVPEGLPHRFLNQTDEPMAMIWVYAGDEPERQLVDAAYCTGALAWKGVPSK